MMKQHTHYASYQSLNFENAEKTSDKFKEMEEKDKAIQFYNKKLERYDDNVLAMKRKMAFLCNLKRYNEITDLLKVKKKKGGNE